ncbi:MAG: phosphoenolpyruvate--protein phosphotransferase [Chitinispirillaceae bacterium]
MNRLRQKIKRELFGEPISPGVAMGDALLFKPIALDALEMNSFPVDDVQKEISRLDYAIAKSRDQLNQIFERLREKNSADIGEIFRVQMQFLDDESFLSELKELVRKQKMNLEHVIASQMRVLETRFQSIQDETLQTKFLDIQDVYHRLLRNLLDIEHVRTNPMQRIEKPVIFVSEKLLPSDVALLDFTKILGIIIEEGSRLSHVAVMSKSLGIPAIIRAPGAGTLIRTGDPVILDGYNGKVLVHPQETEVSSYKEKREYFLASSRPKTHRGKGCITTDGKRIRLEANIGSVKEAQVAMAYGAEGVGLLRTELFYMSAAHQPSLEEERDFYIQITGILKRKPLTIRLLDLGADKSLPFLKTYEEENPQLGTRGIRYLLRNPELFYNHVKAIVSVCRLTPVKIVVPFVAILDDLEKALEMIYRACTELKIDRKNLNLGIMVEIPSVALSLRQFLSRVSFVNLGTNDLAQYLFAASREDSGLEDYRQIMHPVILRLVRNVVSAAKFKDKEVAICGEAASDPLMAALLVGAGVTSFSMQSQSIPVVKETISRWSFTDLHKLVRKALALDNSSEVMELLAEAAERIPK